jgi:hypothetical protein
LLEKYESDVSKAGRGVARIAGVGMFPARAFTGVASQKDLSAGIPACAERTAERGTLAMLEGGMTSSSISCLVLSAGIGVISMARSLRRFPFGVENICTL